MKQMMNKVNPKAGALKQTNENTIQNVSRKLIAFVLMLAITLQPGFASAAANGLSNDSCCSVEKKDKVSKFMKAVKIELPSNENVRKADSEMTSNMHKSLLESKVKVFAKAFANSDAEMNRLFRSETSISTPASANADETMTMNFLAENIAMNSDMNAADVQMNASFTANVKGISIVGNEKLADEWMNIRFQAEHIALPSAELISRADGEINHLMTTASSVAVNQ